MTMEQIKREVEALNPKSQAELVAYLLHLREARDPEYKKELATLLDDHDPSHWLTPDQFEHRLNQR